MKNIKFILFLLIGFGTLLSCTEPYELSSDFFEEQIVIEASITNRFENQRIKVSKTYPIDSTIYQPSTGDVSVKIKNEQGLEFIFSYNEEKEAYFSEQPFKAQPDTEYTLEVVSNQDIYTATSILTTETVLASLNAQKTTNQDGVEGLEVVANSYDPSGTSQYYRFIYEETYKVTAPYWSNKKATVTEIPPEEVWLDPTYEIGWEIDEDIYTERCYKTNYYQQPVLTQTLSLNEDRLTNFPVKFIPKTNYSINERYSIKVTQYVETFDAYNFYKTLNNLSSSGEILSPNQPGFVKGNIKASSDPNKKVIGFFDVVATSSKRIYFNHQDFFEGEPLPPYFIDCDIIGLSKGIPSERFRLISNINTDYLHLFQPDGEIYWMVKPRCSDCAIYANPEPPEFWEE
ncbi:DUF4249 family protein [Mesonia sp.]|uniref:DUF4249 domain-containing protein n=1 Tax=Mesonia sp. TaxID=1960830 RepID=UPI003F9B3A1B